MEENSRNMVIVPLKMKKELKNYEKRIDGIGRIMLSISEWEKIGVCPCEKVEIKVVENKIAIRKSKLLDNTQKQEKNKMQESDVIYYNPAEKKNKTVFQRTVDETGRISIPTVIKEKFNLKEGDILEKSKNSSTNEILLERVII